MPPPPLLRTLLREPLVHFVLAGAALFALDGAARRVRARVAVSAPAPPRIVLGRGLRAELADGFTRANGRAPSPTELDALVARWTEEEVLYREGLARGLDRDDPQVRQRIAAKMGFVLESQVVVPEPREAELRAWFAQHADRYAQGELTDFTQVFVQGNDAAARSRAAELLHLLEAGADPNGLGDRFAGGRRYRRRRIEDLAEGFGREFVAGVSAQPPGRWALHASRYGLHLVRVEQRTPAQAPDYETVRLDVRRDVMRDARDRGRARAMESLRARWQIVAEP